MGLPFPSGDHSIPTFTIINMIEGRGSLIDVFALAMSSLNEKKKRKKSVKLRTGLQFSPFISFIVHTVIDRVV